MADAASGTPSGTTKRHIPNGYKPKYDLYDSPQPALAPFSLLSMLLAEAYWRLGLVGISSREELYEMDPA